MPQITDLKSQQRNKDRISVFVDKKYSFSLNLNQLIDYKLKVDQVLSTQDIRKLKKISEDGKIHDSVLRKLLRRRHSEYEIIVWMRQKNIDQDLIDSIISDLHERDYLNDREFAEWWIEERRRSKQRSNAKLKSELMQKGINRNLIDELIEDSKEEQKESLQKLIQKKKHLSKYQDEKKFISYLQSQGFGYYEIKEELSSLED